ncbi:MAG: hypothetical protein WDN06_10305 [Asticcacaulis sp.]
MNYNTAVIDIGSNSVRLVIYRVEGRSIWPVFNEKVLAGLGRDLWVTRTLHPDGMKETLIALRRFKAILESYKLHKTHVVATAAIREAGDGPAFVETILQDTGFLVRTLSGAEEAYYSAQGVHCGHLDAKGVVGDLGGSSLELINLDGEETGKGVTLPLGPFALGAPQPIDVPKTYATIRERIEPLRDRFSGGQFHAVGGAWRNLALIWMLKQNYPLHVIQQFELPAREALSVCTLIAGQSATALEKMAGVPKTPAGKHLVRRPGAARPDRDLPLRVAVLFGLRPARRPAVRFARRRPEARRPAHRGLHGAGQAAGHQ